jgi:hypothetical protein
VKSSPEFVNKGKLNGAKNKRNQKSLKVCSGRSMYILGKDVSLDMVALIYESVGGVRQRTQKQSIKKKKKHKTVNSKPKYNTAVITQLTEWFMWKHNAENHHNDILFLLLKGELQ